MKTMKQVGLFLILVLLINLCLFMRIIRGIELSNVHETSDTLVEEVFEREYINISKYTKKVLDRITVINNVVYEAVTKKDIKNDNSLVSVAQDKVKELKPIEDGSINYEEIDSALPTFNKKIKDEMSK